HCIYHTPQMAEARGRGGLRANRFVRLRKRFKNGRPLLEVEELGHAEKLLSVGPYLEETTRRIKQDGTVPIEGGWSGWLGRYQAALRDAAAKVGPQRDLHEQTRKPHHERER